MFFQKKILLWAKRPFCAQKRFIKITLGLLWDLFKSCKMKGAKWYIKIKYLKTTKRYMKTKYLKCFVKAFQILFRRQCIDYYFMH